MSRNEDYDPDEIFREFDDMHFEEDSNDNENENNDFNDTSFDLISSDDDDDVF